MMGDATWFEHVEHVKPASIYSYAIESNTLTDRKYWCWSDITPLAIPIEEAAEEMARLLDEAIKLRNFGNGVMGVSLSGGLDSRSILASIYETMPVTYTFGIEQSADVKIARRVARVAGVPHTYYDMNVTDWLRRRFSGVWKTDGMLNMYHMHYSHIMDELARKVDINLSGFLGDLVLGGSYLRKRGKTFLDKKVDQEIALHYCGIYYDQFDFNDPYINIHKVDPYLIYNRCRRMVGLGAEEPSKTIFQRMPFMDNKLMDFSYGLPDHYRLNNSVYEMALLQKYPLFFKDIPDASTGVPIGPRSLSTALKAQFISYFSKVKIKMGMPASFNNVNKWLKDEHTAKFVRHFLDPAHAIYSNYTDDNFVDKYVVPHAKNVNSGQGQVMGALTTEVWFQQLFNKKHIPEVLQAEI